MDFWQPTAAHTRWRVSALPSAPLPVAGFGRPRWLVELLRCRAGEGADFVVEAYDGTGRLGVLRISANSPGRFHPNQVGEFSGIRWALSAELRNLQESVLSTALPGMAFFTTDQARPD